MDAANNISMHLKKHKASTRSSCESPTSFPCTAPLPKGLSLLVNVYRKKSLIALHVWLRFSVDSHPTTEAPTSHLAPTVSGITLFLCFGPTVCCYAKFQKETAGEDFRIHLSCYLSSQKMKSNSLYTIKHGC